MNDVTAAPLSVAPLRGSETLAAEVENRLRTHARHLMRLFFLGDDEVLALTPLRTKTSEQAICQWLMQYQPELVWRDFQGKEFRGVVQALRNRFASLPARVQE